MNRRVLIVSPHFPPVNAPDMQRARQCLPHLAARGWDAEVLAIDPADVAAPLDPLLAARLPPGVPIHRVRAPQPAWARALGLSSLGRRATRALGPAGDQLLGSRRFDLVFFTTAQFQVLTVAPRWSARHRVPLALDWQDPWVTDFYNRPGAPPPPGGWKYRFAARFARRWEGRCVASASGIVSVNAAYLRQLAGRHPGLADRRTAVIPFGVEPADFDVARERDVRPGFARQAGVRHFVSVGAAGPIMRPALELLFAGLRACLEQGAPREAFRFHFIGTSYAPAGRQEPSVRPLAEAAGLGDLVDEQVARIGHFAALRTLQESDAVILLGSADAGYSPSKLATLAFAGRPVLGLVPGGGELEARLRELGLARLARFSPQPESQPVAEFLRDPRGAPPSPAQLAPLTAEARTRELAGFFDAVVRPAAARHP